MAYGITQLGSGIGDSNLYTGDRMAALGDTAFTGYLSGQGIDINALSGADLDTHMQKYTEFGNPIPGSTGGLMGGASLTDIGDVTMGLGQLGLGVASYLDTKKTAGKQREIMDQQIAANKYRLAKEQADSASLAKAFGGN